MEPEGISLPPDGNNGLRRDQRSYSENDFASRKAKEAPARRYEAGAWLRKMVGVVVGKDLPAHPSEDEFRLGLKSGIILCKVLNKVKPNSVPKVIEAPGDSILIPDGEALSKCQYFDNVRNFLKSIREIGLPTFDTSDLEKGGRSSRIVTCVLALKSYKEAGENVHVQVGDFRKPPPSPKQFAGKIADILTSSILRSSVSADSVLSEESASGDAGVGDSGSLSTIVQELLVDKEQDDIPIIVENILSEVMEEVEHRFALQKEQMAQLLTPQKEPPVLLLPPKKEPPVVLLKPQKEPPVSLLTPQKEPPELFLTPQKEPQMVDEPRSTGEEPTSTGEESTSREESESCNSEKNTQNTRLKCQSERPRMLAEQHQRDLQELKIVLDAAKTDLHLLKTTYEEGFSNLGKHLTGLADSAASEYKKVFEENRKLYNLVQDLKGAIRVYCRVRPFLPGQADGVNSVGHLDDESITIIAPSKHDSNGRKSFSFNKVFGPSATQEDVFADTGPLVRSVLDGFNVCIFAYGQTGSGKTHTMAGPDNLTKETMGVNYRALNDLFLISEQRKDRTAYGISVQMMEIYNEQVRDLFVGDGTNQRLEIRNKTSDGINVPDATIKPVSSPSDVLNLMELGQKNRACGSTAMNVRSSRSHSCLTVHVEGRDLESGTIRRGCMHLVDLAGSERLDKTEAVGDRLKEAQHINKSLSALGDVIAALAQKNAHVPYRNSKLTQLLQDSLGGQAKTLMFVHISPEPHAVGETLSTLKFAERVSNVELGAAKSNKESPELKELKEQVASLKAALAKRDGEMGRSPNSSSPERLRRIKSPVSTSPSRASLQSCDAVSEHRQSTDGSESNQIRGSPGDKTKSCLDLHDMSTWPPIGDKLPAINSKSRGNPVVAKWANERVMSPKVFKPKQTPVKTLPAKTPGVATTDPLAPPILQRVSTANGPIGNLRKRPAKQSNIQPTRSAIAAPSERRVGANKTNTRSTKSTPFDGRRRK